MRSNVKDGGRLCSGAIFAVSRFPVNLLAFVALVLGLGTTTGYAESLRWKLNTGDVIHYRLEEKQVLGLKGAGKEKKSTKSSTTDLTWTVKNLTADGAAEVGIRIDRVRVRIEQPPYMPIEFDSNPGSAAVPDEFESADRQIKATAGAEFAFTLRPNGEVDDIKVMPQTLKSLREALPQEGGGQEAVSEQSLKEILSQSSPPSFPVESVEIGKNWAAKPTKIAVPGLGTLKIDRVFTFQGPDPKAAKMLSVGVETRATFDAAENVNAKIRAQEGKGTVTFDADAGRIVGSRNSQKLELIISDRGQEFIQSTETTSTMTLQP